MQATIKNERNRPFPEINGYEITLLEQTRQKPLDHVLGCLCIVALAAHEHVEGIPVIAAKPRRTWPLPGFRAFAVAQGQDQAPAGSLEALDGGQVPGVSGFGIHAHNDNGYALFAERRSL